MSDLEQRLPEGFAALEPYCGRWCLADTTSRNRARIDAEMEDIRDFYQAMIPLAGRALDHLAKFQLGALEPRSAEAPPRAGRSRTGGGMVRPAASD